MDYTELVRCIRAFNDGYWNVCAESINLIDELNLSKNLRETAHSRILYKLLHIGSSRGFPFLKIFLDVIGIKEVKREMTNVKIYIEKEYIDVLLVVDGQVLIIENKVNHASDQPRQIATYYDKICNKEVKGLGNYGKDNVYVIYLTRNCMDGDPNDDSLSEKTRKELRSRERYYKISYETEIRQWIEKCKNYSKQNVNIFSVLVQYGNFLNGMFVENIERDKMMNEELEKALKISDKGLNERFKKVDSVKDSLANFTNEINSYHVKSVCASLRGKSIECKKKDDYSILFKIRYMDSSYSGYANVVSGHDGGYWYGVYAVKSDGKSFLYPWKENENEEREINKALIVKLNRKIERGSFKVNNTIKDYSSTCTDGKYSVYFQESECGLYFFWKYCENIDKMIDEIVEYVRLIGKSEE